MGSRLKGKTKGRECSFLVFSYKTWLLRLKMGDYGLMHTLVG